MPNEDNACIRYLMKEMDPSEELLMERAMMEDEDLLIEVESMRRTLQRLDKLPKRTPPEEITETIVEFASEQASFRGFAGLTSREVLKYAAAAVILIGGLLAGGVLIFDQNLNNGSVDTARAEFGSFSTMADDPFVVTPVNSTKEPWVDRNDVIHFQDQYQTGNRAAFDSILNRSTRRLKPIDDAAVDSYPARPVQLTGARN